MGVLSNIFKPRDKPENRRVTGYKEVSSELGGIAPFKGYAVFSCLLAFFCSGCGSVGKWISPTKLKTISTF